MRDSVCHCVQEAGIVMAFFVALVADVALVALVADVAVEANDGDVVEAPTGVGGCGVCETGLTDMKVFLSLVVRG